MNGEDAQGEEKTEDGEKNEEGKDEENKEQEVVLIQDTGFNVTIVCPGVEEFELPVSLLYTFHWPKLSSASYC